MATCMVLGLGPPSAVAQELTPAIVDLSSHNQVSLTPELRARQGISLVIHRASMGLDMGNFSDADYRFEEQMRAAASAGLRLGAYHLGTRTGSGAQQADDFLTLVKRVCESLPALARRVLLALDWEPSNPDPNSYMNMIEVGRFLERAVARTGKAVTVYTGERFLRERRDEMASVPRSWQMLGRQPLWIAKYNPAGYDHRGEPSREIPWPDVAGTPWSTWNLWQYTNGEHRASGALPVSRIDGQPVDRSVFRGSRADLERFKNTHSWDCVYKTR